VTRGASRSSARFSGGEIVEIKPDMPDAEYAALVARGGKQRIDPDDEDRLRRRVQRVRRA
jgi:hypothetical protein